MREIKYDIWNNFQDFKNYSKTRIFRKVGNKKSVVKMSSNKF